jgi:hypothetical protein
VVLVVIAQRTLAHLFAALSGGSVSSISVAQASCCLQQ